jgi:hypothetical protein
MAAREAITERVVEAVAVRDGVSVAELPPLYETVDPDALEVLFRDTTGTLCFEYHEYEVRVDHDGGVEVSPGTSGSDGPDSGSAERGERNRGPTSAERN